MYKSWVKLRIQLLEHYMYLNIEPLQIPFILREFVTVVLNFLCFLFSGLMLYHRWRHLLGHRPAHVKGVIPSGKGWQKMEVMKNQGYILQNSSGVIVPLNIRRYLKAFSRHGFGSWIRHWRIFHMYLHSYNIYAGWNMRLYAWGSPLKLVYIVTTICRFNNALAAAQDSLKSPSFYIGHSEINLCVYLPIYFFYFKTKIHPRFFPISIERIGIKYIWEDFYQKDKQIHNKYNVYSFELKNHSNYVITKDL